MSEELKPCPFCGGTDVYLRQHLATNMSWVSCAECGLEAPSETGWTDDIAIEYWNTRSDAAKDAEIERLRNALETIAVNMHGSNPSLAYADVPREDYLAHVLYEARQLARAALKGDAQ